MTVCGIKQADGVCVMGKCPYFKKCCPVVWDKSGKPLTNDEWLRSCDTEQLAEFIIKVMLFYDNGGITMLEAIKKAVEDNEKLGSYFMESVLEWLKQPHTNE